MDLGFETIGNACIIVHDRGPVLATDPWLGGTAYFGSWRLSHEVPAEQQANVARCRFLWLSHGHPDHLSLESLERLRDKTILVPDHHGGRVARELRGLGFTVHVLPCGTWFPVSDRVRIASLANYNQDATAVLDIDGHLLVDSNDAGDRGIAGTSGGLGDRRSEAAAFSRHRGGRERRDAAVGPGASPWNRPTYGAVAVSGREAAR